MKLLSVRSGWIVSLLAAILFYMAADRTVSPSAMNIMSISLMLLAGAFLVQDQAHASIPVLSMCLIIGASHLANLYAVALSACAFLLGYEIRRHRELKRRHKYKGKLNPYLSYHALPPRSYEALATLQGTVARLPSYEETEDSKDLYELRRLIKLSVREAAEALHVPDIAIYGLEHGRYRFDFYHAQALLLAYAKNRRYQEFENTPWDLDAIEAEFPKMTPEEEAIAAKEAEEDAALIDRLGGQHD